MSLFKKKKDVQIVKKINNKTINQVKVGKKASFWTNKGVKKSCL